MESSSATRDLRDPASLGAALLSKIRVAREVAPVSLSSFYDGHAQYFDVALVAEADGRYVCPTVRYPRFQHYAFLVLTQVA